MSAPAVKKAMAVALVRNALVVENASTRVAAAALIAVRRRRRRRKRRNTTSRF
jgi:hypothetical protein